MKELKELLKDINIKEVYGDTNKDIHSVSYDSRKVENGSLFVALRGASADGHSFIKAAIFRGASVVLCEQAPDCTTEEPNATFIVVNDSRSALAKIAHAFYDEPSKKLNVIGITGTNGKTTTTYLIKSILETAGHKAGIIGTTGAFFGSESIDIPNTTPESLEIAKLFDSMLKSGVDFAVMEVSSHALCTARVDSVNFSAAGFTNLTHEHLDYHKSIDNYASAKKQLFERLSSDGLAFVNSDDMYGEYFLSNISAINKFRVGRGDNADYIISDEILGLAESSFKLLIKGDYELNMKTSLSGRFNIDNAALSAAICHSFGISNESIIKGLLSASGAPGRMQKVMLKSGSLGLVDYAHTPDALEKALTAAKGLIEESGSGKLICVFGCGGDRDKTKRPEMGRIASSIADYTIITSDNPRTEKADKIIEQIYAGIPKNYKSKAMCVTNRSEAIRCAAQLSHNGDIVVVAGKGHEKYQLIGASRHHFDDVEELGKY